MHGFAAQLQRPWGGGVAGLWGSGTCQSQWDPTQNRQMLQLCHFQVMWPWPVTSPPCTLGSPSVSWRTISVREHGGTAFWGTWHQRRIPILPGFSHLTETPEHPGMSLQSITTNVNKWLAPGRWRPKSNSLNFPDLWLKHQLFSPPLTHTTLIL